MKIKKLIMVILLISLLLSACDPWSSEPADEEDDYSNPIFMFFKILGTILHDGYKKYLAGGGIPFVEEDEDQRGYISDQPEPILPIDPAIPDPVMSEGSNDLPLKPVGFVNYGTINATVRAATYIPLGANEPQTPAPAASTVSSAQGTGGDWPNSSRFISVPLGTYTWCIDWEEEDQDGDGYFDYYHYYETETTLLDENDSDELEFAEEVAIMAPPSVAPIYKGKCGEEDILPKYIWVEVGEGDCVGIDVDSSEGFIPDDSIAVPGITAICWDNVLYTNYTGSVFCTYKSINWEECTGGPNLGKMYTAEEVD